MALRVGTNENTQRYAESEHDGSSGGTYFAAADRSIKTAMAETNAQDGISAKELGGLYDSMADGDGMSLKEAREFLAYGNANYAKMDPEARKMFDKISNEINKACAENPSVLTDGRHTHMREGIEQIVLSSDQMATLRTDINKIGNFDPAAAGTDGTDETPPVETKPTSGSGPTVSSPPAEPEHGPSGPSGAGGGEKIDFGGGSWEEIFAKILQMIDKKEAALKEKAKGVTQKISDETNRANTANAEGGKQEANVSSLNTDLAEITGELKKIEQLVTMVTNLQKTNHETNMTPIRAMA
jgi:hypothetical protein